ncbi:hypothetical protein HMPREF0645_1886 [Hallella bergensis DSM 17361]|uniref:Uncharacterized protein n=1 Tax=Hallella bergensis DSM 17361 TaxID=585502 RepID=D1PY51_9BACT|nr:hypothetical protein HMPREF0645_1886 [Hallella bergensis DSM 17361]
MFKIKNADKILAMTYHANLLKNYVFSSCFQKIVIIFAFRTL